MGKKIDAEVPVEQAAYRTGRGTTEHAFAFKLLAEKAITTPNYHLHITLMDMSEAFDTVQRNTFLKDLRQTLTPAELHITKILIQDVSLKVRIGKETSEEFTTKMGVPQGDCLSPILFTLYLAKALKETNTSQNSDTNTKNDHLPTWLQDHTYSKQKDIGLLIEPKYADDISWGAANCIHEIEIEKKKIPPKLTSRGLIVNE